MRPRLPPIRADQKLVTGGLQLQTIYFYLYTRRQNVHVRIFFKPLVDCFRFFFTFLVPRRQEIAGREGEGTVRGIRDLSMPRDPSPKITTRFPGFHFPGNRSRFPPRRTL